MAATRNEIRNDLTALLSTMYGQNLGVNWNNPVAPAVTMTGLQGQIQAVDQRVNTTRGLIVGFVGFYGTPNEDVEEWCDNFERTYTTNGFPNDDAQRFRIAVAHLGAGASDWFKTEGAAITGWAANDNTGLRHEMMGKYASDRIKEKWLENLEGIKQLKGETVDQYYIRFRYMLKRAGGNATVPAGNQKRIFIKGLETDYIKDVTMGSPVDLARALELAKASEKGYNALKGRFKQEEIEPVVKPKEVIKSQDKYDIDDLTRDFARLRASDEAKMLRLIEENRRLKGQNRFEERQVPTCFNCGRKGHFVRDCRERRRYDRRINVIEGYDDYGYMDDEDQGYENYNEEYGRYDEPSELYYNEYELYGPQRTKRRSNRKDPLTGYKNIDE